MVNNCGQEQNGRLCNHGSGESSNASKVGCACKTGHKSVSDYIQTTYGTTFNILRAPFKRTFLEKLSGLTRNYVPTFDHDEIMDIMMIFDYSKASDLLAYAVVVYLMNNPGLVNQIQRHDSAKFNSPKLKQFYDLMFLTCDNGRSFSEIISSHIVLNLVDNNGETAKLHGNSECYDPIIIYANLHESLVNFLFPHLSLSFSFLERNQQILEKMVDNKMFCSYLRIEIHSIDMKVDGKSIEAFSSEQQRLSYQFNVLSTSKLVKCSYEVRLEFENYGDEGNCASFSKMKNLKSISCRSCSAKFISSIPEKIEVAMDVPDDRNVPTNIPMNTMQASFSDIIFTTDMTLPEQIKDIKISN
ncbi:hypothetical protein VCUG_02644 [Vavraia culicis subsp. floridensis]|uniref:Uncharacterized protein n=1 Tax=Vavraia culicis (isolate floridensis) TaxID=948595 RepID=L2GR88_VAVCU|nr:uncharacterized protein VCUG_02644 [Vavraia culicis subsp. floridensis]ELA45867.1 hypothetical protein VCUG_02644 [Vavraia culicis subsp. floridensis]